VLKLLHRLKKEQLIGLLFVVLLHGAALYELWRYRIIPTPDEALTLMVNLINPPLEQKKPPKLEPLKPPPSKLPIPEPVMPPKPQQLVAETSVVVPAEPVVYVPPAPPPPAPVVIAPPLPVQPVTLSGELSVACTERTPPEFPALSIRMNEQGKVVLRVELGEDGRIIHAEVKTSSGYRRLDEAALNAVKTWRCKPPVRNGATVRAVALQPFNFYLEGR
jgi:protein TonB